MGFVHARTEVTNITGGDTTYSAMFLVDTGSTDTIIPSDELEKPGITRERKRSYELADGTIVEHDVGFAFLQVQDEKVVTEPLVMSRLEVYHDRESNGCKDFSIVFVSGISIQ